MSAIKAMVRNGRIETEAPLQWPDGTVVRVVSGGDENDSIDVNDDWDDSPEGIEEWLNWYDSLVPVDDLSEILARNKKEQIGWQLAHSDEYHEKLRRIFG